MSSLKNYNKKLIRVEDCNTFPIMLEELVKNFIPEIKYIMKIKNINTYDFGALYYKSFNDFITNVVEYLNDFSIVGYHNTRVLDKISIKNNGLYLLEPDNYLNYIKKVFYDLNIDLSMQKYAFKHLEDYLSNKYGNRTDRICFFSPYRICQTFSKFALNIGGEICEFALSDNLPDVYSKLCSNGYPITVEFKFKFNNIANYDKEKIAFEFVKFYLEKLVENNNYPIEFSGALVSPVLPKDIIEIYDFIDEFKD